MKKAGIAVLCAVLAACASMGRNECVNANWYAIGLEDGARGSALERLGEHRRACAEYGVAPNADQYSEGTRRGTEVVLHLRSRLQRGAPGPWSCERLPARARGQFRRGLLARAGSLRPEPADRAGAGQIRRTKAALTAGIPEPRARAREAQRLEDLSREAEQLEAALARLPAK